MRKYFVMMMMAVVGLCLTACGDDDAPSNPVSVGGVEVTLTGISGDYSNIEVTLRGISTFTAQATAAGKASFTVTPGIYEVTASGTYANNGTIYTANGTAGQVTVNANQTTAVTVELKEAKTSQIIIKELYNGGCLKEDNKTFQFDKCIILYNNSAQTAVLDNLCIGMAAPANGHANNNNYDADGKLTYESQGFTPASHGIWWFQQPLTVEPYKQVVVNICGAIDNTLTVPNSVNYANADYYCMYDPESGYNLTNYYPTPAAVIPTSHYLKAKEYGLGTGWTFSVTSPAVYIFQTKGTTPAAFGDDETNMWYDGGKEGSAVYACKKVPNEWILDGMEVWQKTKVDDSKKRLTADIDAGYVTLTNYMGHVLYRNVDKQATEALPENAGKLVYNYALGVDGSTDPSGIDAEASMKQGAHIVFQDTNNSTADFHERARCSLKD